MTTLAHSLWSETDAAGTRWLWTLDEIDIDGPDQDDVVTVGGGIEDGERAALAAIRRASREYRRERP